MIKADKYEKLVEMKKKAKSPLMAFEGREISLHLEAFSAAFIMSNDAPSAKAPGAKGKNRDLYEEKKNYLGSLMTVVDKEYQKYYENAFPDIDIKSVPQFEDIIFEVEAPGYVNIYAVNGLGTKDFTKPSFVSDDFSIVGIPVEQAYPWLGILLQCENTRVKEMMDAVIMKLNESEDYDEKAMSNILRGRQFYPFRYGK